MIKAMTVMTDDILVQELCQALCSKKLTIQKYVSMDGSRHGIMVISDDPLFLKI